MNKTEELFLSQVCLLSNFPISIVLLLFSGGRGLASDWMRSSRSGTDVDVVIPDIAAVPETWTGLRAQASGSRRVVHVPLHTDSATFH